MKILKSTLSVLAPSKSPLTESGRAHERRRRAVLTAIAAASARLISISTALITVPITLNYLGQERYGMWMTLSSFIAILGFADLGIGNGVLNAVSAASGKDDDRKIREYTSSGVFILSIIGFIIFMIFMLASRYTDWSRLFNVSSQLAVSEAGPSLLLLVLFLAMGIPVGIVQRVQMGLQNGFIANLWQCAGSILALAGVLISVRLHAGLPWLVTSFIGAPVVASIANGLIYFAFMKRDYCPSFYRVTLAACKQIANIGLMFFVLQMASAITFASDNIIIAQILGPEAVAEFSVPQKVFSLVTTVIMMLLTPLWPAYGEAIARGDRVWVRDTLLKSIFASFILSSVMSIILIYGGNGLISLWVGQMVTPTFLLLATLGVWQVISVCGNAIAMFLNGANVVKFQVYVATITTVSSLLMKILLLKSIGIPGVVVGVILAYTIFTIIPYYFFIRKRFGY